LAISTFLIHCALAPLTAATSSEQAVLLMIALGLGAFLLIGLFTPIAGMLGALLEAWTAFSHQEEWWACILAAAIALALALLGPGSWSLDALAYGRKRVSIHHP
jgi:uncharacterized membrane protein YphA (DoxX/SURF4 family)